MTIEELADCSRTDSARRRNPHVHQSYIIPVLSKALVLIEVMKKSERPLNVDELARRTGIAKSTVYRILRTLSAYGYLPDGADGIYSFRHVPYIQKESVSAGERSRAGHFDRELIHVAVPFNPKGKGWRKLR